MSSKVGADAISSYISEFRRPVIGRYVDLDQQTQAYWRKMATSGSAIIPIAMVGWDTRPRQERPGPWSHGAEPNPNPTTYYALATPDEFAAELREAVSFIQSNPLVCASKSLLIYSWDECDEGGGIIPTLGDPNGSYLSAIARVLS